MLSGMISIQRWFLATFGTLLLLLAIRRLRTYRLKERYALLFLLIGLPFVGLAFWPEGVAWMASKLGIQYPTLALICVSVYVQGALGRFAHLVKRSLPFLAGSLLSVPLAILLLPDRFDDAFLAFYTATLLVAGALHALSLHRLLRGDAAQ